MRRDLFKWLKKPYRLQRALNKLLSLYYNEQWIILVSKSVNRDSPKWDDFKPLQPPPNCDWADPFLWKHDGRIYAFIEEKPAEANNAHISYIALDDDLNITSSGVALKRPYHLSYPLIFSYKDNLYMMPETKGNRAVEVYRCIRFPDQWEFHKTLIPNVGIVDATLFENQNKWWLFANIEDDHGSTWTQLHLFLADSPLSESWVPHPKNPVVKDIRTSRPAGNILFRSDAFIRPSQDSSVRYGYATNFMQIQTLSETDYAETRAFTFKPAIFRNIIGVHTWNELDDLTIIDASIRHR